MNYWLRCAVRRSVAFIDAPQAYKRLHGHNMQVDFVTNVLPDLEQRLAAIAAFLQADRSLVIDPDRLLRLARRATARESFWAASKAFDRGDLDQCQKLLAAARQWDPELPRDRAWSRLAWKRTLGTRVWQAVRPLVDRFRSLGAGA